jgi:Eukaryotic phosphomannomutase
MLPLPLSSSDTHLPFVLENNFAGSDLAKQEEQLGAGVVNAFPWNFSQNGLVAYKEGKLLEVQTLSKHLGEDNVKRIVNWVMKYLSEIDLPIKVRTWLCRNRVICYAAFPS